MEKIAVVMRLERVLRHNVRYADVRDPPRLGTVYVAKHDLGGSPYPEEIVVEVSWKGGVNNDAQEEDGHEARR